MVQPYTKFRSSLAEYQTLISCRLEKAQAVVSFDTEQLWTPVVTQPIAVVSLVQKEYEMTVGNRPLRAQHSQCPVKVQMATQVG